MDVARWTCVLYKISVAHLVRAVNSDGLHVKVCLYGGRRSDFRIWDVCVVSLCMEAMKRDNGQHIKMKQSEM